MSGRRIPVDLGPLSLHVLDDGRSCASPPTACIDDVLRLRAAMRGGAAPPQGFARDSGVAGDDGVRAGWAATCPALGIAVTDDCEAASLNDAHVELLAFEVSVAQQSLKGMSTSVSPELRLVLRPMVLRDAELVVADSGGQLEFSLWVGDADDRQWLALQLPRLVATLGERLRRRLRVRVFAGLCMSQPLAEQSWPPEGDA